MGGAKYFTSFDLHSGYWKCCIADQDILKTTFFMRHGLYERVVMPMGFTNAPTTFMQTINYLFSDILDFGMVVFLDDILVYSYIEKEHFTLLNKVLACLYQYIIYCKLKKYTLLYNNTMFFSFDITLEGMLISDSKVWSLNEWPIPTIVK